MNYKEALAKKIADIVNLSANEIEEYIEIPPNSELGDYAFPCFRLAKELKKAPPVIASEIKEKMVLDDVVNKIDVV